MRNYSALSKSQMQARIKNEYKDNVEEQRKLQQQFENKQETQFHNNYENDSKVMLMRKPTKHDLFRNINI